MTATPLRSLLLIDDDEVDRKAVRRALQAAGTPCLLHEASDGRQGLDLARTHPVDCILLDYHLPDIDGLDLLHSLQAGQEVSSPIVMLTGEGNEVIAVEAMKRGAQDYLPKSLLRPDTLFRALSSAVEKHALQRQLAAAQRQLERQALYDPLTGLGNRNLFRREIALALARAERRRGRLCILLIDLDRFKAVNDTHGHEAGDAVLAEVGRRLGAAVRGTDTFYRLGGDEFTAILEMEDGAAGAGIVTRRIAEAVAQPIPFAGHQLQVGASIGIALFPDDGTDEATLLRHADAAMYREKQNPAGKTTQPAEQ